MKILALEKEVPGVAAEEFTDELLQTEAAKAWELYQAGILRELYFTADTHEAVFILECSGTDEARTHLAGLPLVHAGWIDFELKPLVPYPGFAQTVWLSGGTDKAQQWFGHTNRPPTGLPTARTCPGTSSLRHASDRALLRKQTSAAFEGAPVANSHRGVVVLQTLLPDSVYIARVVASAGRFSVIAS